MATSGGSRREGGIEKRETLFSRSQNVEENTDFYGEEIEGTTAKQRSKFIREQGMNTVK